VKNKLTFVQTYSIEFKIEATTVYSCLFYCLSYNQPKMPYNISFA